MGALWEILQTGMMYSHYKKTGTTQERVEALEQELERTQDTMKKLVKKIEQMHGLDIDGDGKVG